MPRSNSDWWSAKLSTNKLRDRSVDSQLHDLGWRVLRFWEHEDPTAAAMVIAAEVNARNALAPS